MRELVEMKMAGREPILRVTIGPYLACRFRRIGSSSKKVLRSHFKFPMRGTPVGPGGSFSFGKRKSERDLRESSNAEGDDDEQPCLHFSYQKSDPILTMNNTLFFWVFLVAFWIRYLDRLG